MFVYVWWIKKDGMKEGKRKFPTKTKEHLFQRKKYLPTEGLAPKAWVTY